MLSKRVNYFKSAKAQKSVSGVCSKSYYAFHNSVPPGKFT